MKIGVSSYSFQQLIGSGEYDQKGVVRLASELGFDGIEFTDLSAPGGVSEAQYAQEIREECDKYNLPVAAYTIGADLLKGDDEVERVCGKLDVAAILGAPALRHDTAWGLSGGDKSYKGFENVLSELAGRCRQITEYAHSLGIVTMTENHGQFCQESARLEKLVNAVAHPNFGVLCDIGNFNCADENSAEAVGRLLPYIKHVHAKDFHIKSGNGINPGEGFFRTRAGNYLRGAIIGHGDVPVYQCVRSIISSGYDGFISIEFEGMENCLDAIRIGLNNLKGMI